ncbi:hypothetical protein T11_3494 [Trichinella zimbabwensis]|uniref:Uncharacterized protein n=1 Tax=Trichinella zimbabwensis TaxID=268475 RepID=A0A0V1GU09_9BILA|nr:hypothetical protein T11_3494 [Trichinella zimbabwensis]
MPVPTTSGCCEKPDRNSDSQTTPPLTLMFYATQSKSAHDPPVGRDPHFENHWRRAITVFQQLIAQFIKY